MKKFALLLLFLVPCIVFAQQQNAIGIEYGGYNVFTPKYDLEGNNYNYYMSSKSSMVGAYYERSLLEFPLGFKTGLYVNKQFDAVISYLIPLEVYGNIAGDKLKNRGFVGYIAGVNANFVSEVVTGFRFTIPDNLIEDELTIDKGFYIAPHIGLQAGLHIKKVRISASTAFNFLVPEFINYKTVYINQAQQQTTEYNTNKNYGYTLKIGAAYRF